MKTIDITLDELLEQDVAIVETQRPSSGAYGPLRYARKDKYYYVFDYEKAEPFCFNKNEMAHIEQTKDNEYIILLK